MKNVKNIALIILLFIIVLSLADKCARDKQLEYFKEKQQLEDKIMNDSLVSYRLDNGVLSSQIDVLQSVSKHSLLDIRSKDSMIIRLQKEVRENNIKDGGSVTVFKTITKLDTLLTTDTIYYTSSDTITKDSLPTYGFSFNDSWVNVTGEVDNKKTKLGISIENKYSVIIKKVKRKHVAVVINDNPYSNTEEVRAYKLKMPKKKRFGVGIQGGYGISSSGLSPYVGVGLSYNIIKF